MNSSIIGQEPHWVIVSIFGAIIGLVLPLLLRVFVSLLERRKLHQLEGTWHQYFYNFDVDEPKLKKEIWKIKKGISHPLIIEAMHDDDSGIVYKGTIEFEKEFALIKMNAKSHDESVFLRIPMRVPGSDKIMVALSAAQDYGGRATVGANIVTKVDMSEDEVKSELQKRTKIDRDKRVMRIKSR